MKDDNTSIQKLILRYKYS